RTVGQRDLRGEIVRQPVEGLEEPGHGVGKEIEILDHDDGTLPFGPRFKTVRNDLKEDFSRVQFPAIDADLKFFACSFTSLTAFPGHSRPPHPTPGLPIERTPPRAPGNSICYDESR